MAKQYNQLTLAERYQITIMHCEGRKIDLETIRIGHGYKRVKIRVNSWLTKCLYADGVMTYN